MTDPKVIASTVAAGLGATIALIRSVSEFIGEQSPALKMKAETERATEMMDLVAKLQAQQTKESAAACEQIRRGLEATLAKLGALAVDASKVARDPNSDLTFAQRLFIMFRPVGVREYIIHALAYAAAAGGTLLFLFHNQLQSKFPHAFADLIVLACYGLIVFRIWALAERRWRRGHEPAPDVLCDAIAARKPLSRQMQAAQISMWFCLFWLVEGVEDVITDFINGTLSITDLLAPAMALVATAMCRAWADAEFNFAMTGQKDRSWRVALSRRKEHSSLAWVGRIVFHLGILPLLLVVHSFVYLLKPMPGMEPIDVLGFICTTVLCIVAYNQQFFVLQWQMRECAEYKATPVMARAAAA
jgi:hypothetical protein